MNPIKQLAGQTAIYGISSIVGRVLTYLLVPIYTRVFIPEEYGIVNEMYAYVSLLIVILTYGFETGFFRFLQLEPDKKKVYSTALISLLSTSLIFVLFAIFFAQPIADTLRYPDNKEYVVWFSLIIALDALASIPFALLRSQNKAKRFATIKIVGIIVNVLFNLFFILLCPYMKKHGIMNDFVDLVYKGKVGVGYVFISNLISSGVTLLFLLPEILRVKYRFDFKLWKSMMRYSLPLLIVGLAGIVNETMDRIFLKYLLPKNIGLFQVGIYGACYKISIIMTLFVQAFRFAAEPFFFSHAKNENAKQIYADVMKYFVIICTFIFLLVMLYIDVFKNFVGVKYYEGLPVVPILLMANLCLGIYYNLSIWYKLTGQTKFGALISIFGALLTVVLNLWLIPIIGYMGSAWTTLICYATMMILSFIFGQKYYNVNYNMKKILGYIGLSLLLYVISIYIKPENNILLYSFN
ncbi:MAG: oligosaccharide flippase family protein, partial [Bacteroidetes bacterium]|nr:oligosaccharide flippase family protein [Bacteroidota bacterium]